MHPELETWIRYCDGEGDAAGRRSLRKHLSRCDICRLEVERLHRAEAPGESPLDVPLAPVVDEIRHWSARRRQEDPRTRMVISRVATAIVPYLGESGSRQILAGISESGGGDLLWTIEPVLAGFLGRRAAKRLIRHVVDYAIMRI